jgi:hypothetical protein
VASPKHGFRTGWLVRVTAPLQVFFATKSPEGAGARRASEEFPTVAGAGRPVDLAPTRCDPQGVRRLFSAGLGAFAIQRVSLGSQ